MNLSIFYAMCSLQEFLAYCLIPTCILYYICAILFSLCRCPQLLTCVAFMPWSLAYYLLISCSRVQLQVSVTTIRRRRGSEARRGAAAVHGVVVVKGRGLDSDADHLCRRVNTHHKRKQLASQVGFPHLSHSRLPPLLAAAALKLAGS